MSHARISGVLQETENYQWGFNHTESFIDGFVALKALRTFELAIVYNALKGDSYIRGLPLMLALALKDGDIIENGKLDFLLSRCNDINTTIAPTELKAHQGTSLHYLLSLGKIDIANEFVRIAKEKGLKIDVAKKDENGLTILHLAARVGAASFVKNLGKLCVSALDIQDNHGATASHYAHAMADGEMIASFMALGANQEIKDNDQRIPRDMLHLNFAELEVLLKDKFGVEVTDQLKGRIKKDTLQLICRPIQAQTIDNKRVSKVKI